MITAFQANNRRLDAMANAGVSMGFIRRLERKIKRASRRCKTQTSIRFFCFWRSQDYVNAAAKKLIGYLNCLGYGAWQSGPRVLQVNWEDGKYIDPQ